MSHAAPALRLENVASGYKGAVVLNDISLSVAGGACVALLGKNGMGKSTLLKTVMGYLPKLRGKVSLGGVDATGCGRTRSPAAASPTRPRTSRCFPT